MELPPGTPVMVTVRPGFLADPEHEGWLRLAGESFEAPTGTTSPNTPSA
jgi:hypothetical protein